MQKYEQVVQRVAPGLATPAPYDYDHTGQIFSRPYLVVGYVEGEMTFSPPDLASTLCQLAAQLAKIHQLDPAEVSLPIHARLTQVVARSARR